MPYVYIEYVYVTATAIMLQVGIISTHVPSIGVYVCVYISIYIYIYPLLESGVGLAPRRLDSTRKHPTRDALRSDPL